MFDISEAKEIVHSLIHLYKQLFEHIGDVTILGKNIAMANFVTYMHIPEGHYLDLASAGYDVKNDKGVIF